MPESVPMYHIDKENSGQTELRPIQGEIEGGREVSKLSSVLASTEKAFGNYIAAVLEKKGGNGKLSSAEAAAVRFDLAKELRVKPVGGEIIKEIKAEPYYDTGKQLSLPTDTGDAKFKIIIFFNEETRQYKFRLEAVNDLAKQLEVN